VDERGDAPELVALCEHRSPVAAQPAGQDELAARLRAALGVRVQVRVLAAGTLPRTEVGKAVRVVRWADGEPPVPGLG
jgi:phenylacetate-CoA ligase